MNVMSNPSVGPFVGVSADKVRKFSNGRSFRFIVYGAYNAGGLIGPEMNGIAVLDEDEKSVVCDCIEKQQSGYFGPSAAQLEMHKRMSSEDFTFNDLKKLVNSSDRARVTL